MPFFFLLLAGWDADLRVGARAALLDRGLGTMIQEDRIVSHKEAGTFTHLTTM